MSEFTYEGGGQRHWSDQELFPTDPMDVQGVGGIPSVQQVSRPAVQPSVQPAPGGAAQPRQQEPIFVAPGVNPRNDPFATPPGRSYAHPRLSPTWQHATPAFGSLVGSDKADNIYALVVIGSLAGLGYAATGKWQWSIAGLLFGVGITQCANFALTKSWMRLAGGLAGLGGGGYMAYKLKGGRSSAIANKARSWLQPCTENCGDSDAV